MSQLRISLFGNFNASYEGESFRDWGSSKAEELLCYLLLNRERAHARELLASALWEYATTAQSKAYLRKALWQAQSVLKSRSQPAESPLFLADSETIRCNPDIDLWLDVEVFESAYLCAKDVPGRDLDEEQAAILREAVNLYEGDLLENYFHDWCLHERERFRHLLLSMFDKLTGYHEAQRNYEAAISYAERSLSYDRAREYTHRQLMRLQYMSGDRTLAVRQYEICVEAMCDELNMEPADATVRLYEEIRSGGFDDADRTSNAKDAVPSTSVREVLNQLKAAVSLLAEANHRLRKEIAVLEKTLIRTKR